MNCHFGEQGVVPGWLSMTQTDGEGCPVWENGKEAMAKRHGERTPPSMSLHLPPPSQHPRSALKVRSELRSSPMNTLFTERKRKPICLQRPGQWKTALPGLQSSPRGNIVLLAQAPELNVTAVPRGLPHPSLSPVVSACFHPSPCLVPSDREGKGPQSTVRQQREGRVSQQGDKHFPI